MSQKLSRPAVLGVLLFVPTLLCFPGSLPPSSDAPSARIGQAKPAPGGPRLVTRRLKSENKALKYEIDIEHPELVGVEGAIAGPFRDAIGEFVKEQVSEFEKDVKALAAESGTDPDRANSFLDIAYDAAYIDRSLVSLLIQISTYTGGAHPLPATRAFTYDLKRGRFLTLADLFRPGADYLKRLSDLCIAELLKLGLGDDDWIRNGAGPEADNFAAWNITPEGLQLTFGVYQVASYADGPQEVVVPYPALKPIAKPGGLLDAFMK